MPIPDFQTLMLPLLQLAADGQEYSIRDARETLADQFTLSLEEKTVFRTTPPPPPPAPCINSTGDLPAGDMVREDGNEYVCRSANDLELTGRRIATDSFFTP